MPSPWITRELERFATGHYKKLPFALPQIPPDDPRTEHFPHPSREDQSLIAYTESPAKGADDKKRQIKIGKYLEKFFSHELTKPQIASYSAIYRTMTNPENALHIATTPDECEQAYRSVSSCMSFATPQDKFVGPVHPARAFGSPDENYVTVAYLLRNGKPNARALINRRTKKFQSLYGDTTSLTATLEREGYSKLPYSYATPTTHLALIGLRLNALSAPNGKFCAPCVDYHTHGRIDLDPETKSRAISLTIVSAEEYARLPPTERLTFGYYRGVTGP